MCGGVGHGTGHPPPAIRRERISPVPRLGVGATRLDAAPDRPSVGRDGGRGEPMAQAGPRRGRRGLAPASRAGPPAQADARAAGAVARALGPRRRSLRLPRRPVDSQARGGRDRAHLGGALPPGACQPPPARARLEPAATGRAGRAAPGGGDPGVVRGALARAQKGAAREGRAIVWGDESGFSLLPGRVRTHAPRGHTPILRVPLTRDHLSAISGITSDGRLFAMVRAPALRGADVVRSLRHLLRHLPGTLPVLWDGAPIHRARGQAVPGRRRCAAPPVGAAPRLRPRPERG